MRAQHSLWLIPLTLLALATVSWAAEMDAMKQEAETKNYRLQLQIGPKEEMFSRAEVAAKHPTSGEVMVRGRMAGMSMGQGMAMDVRHLEVHVVSRATDQVVTNARCRITVTSDSGGKRMKVSPASMYGIQEGPADWHYGNNVTMPAGAYTILVEVNGERVTFHVTIPNM
jgi:hypothetical protein